jgi:hypothetical protein
MQCVSLYCHDETSNCWCVIFVDIFSHVLLEPAKDIMIQQYIDGLTRRDKLVMDNSFSVEERDEHELHIAFHSPGLVLGLYP